MKKKRGILLFFVSILTFFLLFVSYSCAYTTNNYSIDIPVTYSYIGEDNFADNYGHGVNVTKEYVGDTTGFKYNEDTLNELVDYVEEIGNMMDYSYSIIDKDIIKFGKNNYKGFYLRSSLSSNNIYIYADQYIVLSGDYWYTLTIVSTNFVDLNSDEIKDIVDSFTIKNFEPVGNNFVQIGIVISIIVLIVLAIILIIKILDDRKKNDTISSAKQVVKSESSDKQTVQTNNYKTNSKIYSTKETKNQKSNDALFIGAIILVIGVIIAIILKDAYIVLDTILTIVAYMIYPFSCLADNNIYSKEEALKISIINSIVVAIIFMMLRVFFTGINSISINVAFLYGLINYSLLKNNEKINNKYNTQDDENK